MCTKYILRDHRLFQHRFVYWSEIIKLLLNYNSNQSHPSSPSLGSKATVGEMGEAWEVGVVGEVGMGLGAP